MSKRAMIATVLRKGDRRLWLDPEDALEMADDLIAAGITLPDDAEKSKP